MTDTVISPRRSQPAGAAPMLITRTALAPGAIGTQVQPLARTAVAKAATIRGVRIGSNLNKNGSPIVDRAAVAGD